MNLIIWDFRNTLCNTDKEELLEGAVEILLKFASKYNYALISSISPERMHKRISLLEKLDFDGYFKEIDLGPKSAEQFESLAHKFGSKLEETIVVGDRYDSEIKIGNELGMKTIWFKHGDPDEKELDIKYTHKITSLKELENLL